MGHQGHEINFHFQSRREKVWGETFVTPCNGDQWRLVTTSGEKWRPLAINSYQWRQLATSGDNWRPVATSGENWRPVATYRWYTGCPKSYLTIRLCYNFVMIRLTEVILVSK